MNSRAGTFPIRSLLMLDPAEFSARSRTGSMEYTCVPAQKIGARIKVASWAPVAEGASGEPAWDVVARHLREEKVLRPSRLNRPRLIGVRGNPGIA